MLDKKKLKKASKLYKKLKKRKFIDIYKNIYIKDNVPVPVMMKCLGPFFDYVQIGGPIPINFMVIDLTCESLMTKRDIWYWCIREAFKDKKKGLLSFVLGVRNG